MGKIIIGDFDGERFWEKEENAKLPFLKGTENFPIIMAMDELQALFCQKGDILYTRFPMNFSLKEYFNEIGMEFKHMCSDTGNSSIYAHSIMEEFYQFLKNRNYSFEGMELDPFEISPFTKQLIGIHGITGKLPELGAVRFVNSKIYSCRMRERVGCQNLAKEISHSSEIEKIFREFKEKGNNCILKEEYGVSGRGNLLLQTDTICRRIVAYIKKQEEQGKKAHFIIEPFLEKKEDFSCQFFIFPSGGYQLLAVQKVWNTGLSYKGSLSPDGTFLEFLDETGYFKIIERLAKRLFEDGYYGQVCVDSMILKDGTMEPIVEINARKSMSLIKYSADILLKRYERTCLLSSLDVIVSENSCSFETLLELLKQEHLLFMPEHPNGILPLTERTLFINQSSKKIWKGKFYFLCVEEEREKQDAILKHFKELLIKWKFKLV